MENQNCTILNDINTDEVPITNEEYETILNLQSEVLALTALDIDTQIILDKLCTMLEVLLPNAVSSLMIKNIQDGLLYVKAAPSVPTQGWDALNGLKPGPHSGSCGNAVHRGKPQFISNTFTDERGTEFIQTAEAFNLCSCWSMPVKDENNLSIGSIALSSFEHRSPARFHKKLLETASSIVSIILQNEANRQKIYNMAYTDTLLGLNNKLALQNELQKNNFNTLVFLDINNFSYVNTAYGFDTGDEILKEVAAILEELYPNALYRINADQFALRFEDKKDIKAMYLHIKTIFSQRLITLKDVKIKISFTYGGVYSNKDILKHAALSLKKAKENGRNRLHIFDETIDSSVKRKEFIFMNSCLYTAFETDTIMPYFQGIYNNTQKKITKYEALVRLKTKEGEILSPDKFLDVAKLSGLLPEITKIMIDKTFAFMAKNNYDFSINITEDDLTLVYLLKYLQEKEIQYKIAPSRVTLEILEGISANTQKNNIAQLKELKRHGYKLAIDDFGAEYSNFERVLALDIDFLKIDARYIKNIDTDKKSFEIVKAIVGFSKNMNIIIIAEFVHSKSVQKIVQELGIEFSQGYYFSEPKKNLLDSITLTK
ncbi:EAL domain-containing protein [Sulfurimonas sp. SAG-AH-194-C21]|nr:EAL domain-containing protein [Sulfurimonas sp. SAG-AH-194-C21]MDF1883459.1 EAL domain-containing protein [Sulfurimonas sp. SAG-AH-194-C21]